MNAYFKRKVEEMMLPNGADILNMKNLGRVVNGRRFGCNRIEVVYTYKKEIRRSTFSERINNYASKKFRDN